MDARDRLLKNKLLRKEMYDKNVNPLYKDNLILIRNPSNNKTQPIYLGPYRVTEDLCPNVKILRYGKIYIIHKNRTKIRKCLTM